MKISPILFKNFFVALLVGAALLFAFSLPAVGVAQALEPTPEALPSGTSQAPIAPATSPTLALIVDLAGQFASLLGVAGLIASIVNVLKLTPLIKDGATGPWYAGLSLLAFGALVYFHVFRGIDVSTIDSEAANFTSILIFLTAYLVQLKAGQSWHDVLKLLKIPGISTSFTPPNK